MSSDSSDTTLSNTPLDVAVEGLVLRADAFATPVDGRDPAPVMESVSLAHAAVRREKADLALAPVWRSIPLWALIPIIGIGIAAGAYLGPNFALGPNLKGFLSPLDLPEGEGPGGAAVDEYDPKVWLAKGKGEFATVCASCHQGTGEGVPGLYPPLKNSEWVINGEERVIAILLHGIAGQIQVLGKTYNGAMPAQGAVKNNKALAQLASYIRNEWGNKASLIYDDQIVELRKKLSTRTGPYTAAELEAIPQQGNLPPSKHGGPPAAAAVITPPAASVAPTPAPAPSPSAK